MTRTSSHPALLRIALQDLRAGKVLLAGRLPALRDAATAPTLKEAIAGLIEGAGVEAARLVGLGLAPDGPENIWMAGILDDADRDAGSHQPGVLLDIALVGALRKAMAAQIVSSDTAIALARQAGLADYLAAAEANRADEAAADRRLHRLLAAFTTS